jgi:hypothetical protein
MNPKSNDCCPYKEGRTQKKSEEGNVKVEAETGMMHLQAKEYHGLFIKAKRRHGTVFPSPEGILDFWSPELGENKFLLFYVT